MNDVYSILLNSAWIYTHFFYKRHICVFGCKNNGQATSQSTVKIFQIFTEPYLYMLAFFFFLQYSKQYHAIELVLILDGWWDSFGLKKKQYLKQ